ncbi:PH domain-containing protein [Dermatophilaceae bacterium Soc4.6]
MVRGPSYERYLIADERHFIAAHRHWGVLAVPVSRWVGALVLAVWAGLVAPDGAGPVTNALWWVFFGVTGWLLWDVIQWRLEWFVVTNKRMFVTKGAFSKIVPMMPMTKVTDLTYVRPLLGRVFGFGEFVLESAGQDQALREIRWIKDPDETYLAICTELFGSPDDDAPRRTVREADDDADDEADDAATDDADEGWAQEWLTQEPWEPEADPAPRPLPSAVSREGDFSRPVPITPGRPAHEEHRYDASHEVYEPWQPDPTRASDPYASESAEGESLYASDDLARRHTDDTGPVGRDDD